MRNDGISVIDQKQQGLISKPKNVETEINNDAMREQMGKTQQTKSVLTKIGQPEQTKKNKWPLQQMFNPINFD